jgi:transcriptional regulator with XRE-family HTH domain
MNLHEKIRVLRQVKGWTQEEVADKLKMSANGYGSIERGETNVSVKRLRRIADVFGIDVVELVGSEDKFFYNQMGDNNIYNNYQLDDPKLIQTELRHELEKKTLLLVERDKEIAYLKEIINLLRSQLE